MNIAFDTLGATKRLRDAGLEERAAEAIVELVQSTARSSRTSAAWPRKRRDGDEGRPRQHGDTRADTATKADLVELAHATKMDIQALKADLAITKTQILVELNDKLRFQSFALMGGVTAIVGLATAIIKLGS
jgi:hypothetical protein